VNGLLLDSHAFLWFAGDDDHLSVSARETIIDGNQPLWISIASLWELSIKISLEKLKLKESLEELVKKQVDTNRLQILALSPQHTYALQRLPFHHRDPFDRLLIVQARIENLKLVSNDETFDKYKVERIW
jgi:PIN domain nuclease of toxin-antitoxin system